MASRSEAWSLKLLAEHANGERIGPEEMFPAGIGPGARTWLRKNALDVRVGGRWVANDVGNTTWYFTSNWSEILDYAKRFKANPMERMRRMAAQAAKVAAFNAKDPRDKIACYELELEILKSL
jgi:hypothetical protein